MPWDGEKSWRVADMLCGLAACRPRLNVFFEIAAMASRNQARRAAVQALYGLEIDPEAAVPLVRRRLVDTLDKPPEKELTAEEQAERDMAEEARERLEAEEAERGNTVVAFTSLSRPEAEPADEEDSAAAEFGWSLVEGVREHADEIDARLSATAENWSVDRMALTDKCVLRVGVYELLHTETPRTVVIDQAVRLAKTFGGANSGAFVNGVLDKLDPAAAVPEQAAGEHRPPSEPTEAEATPLSNRLPMEVEAGSSPLAGRLKRPKPGAT
ncbi:MAG: transcription antitermination factor NusB [Planctomycetota bacterium]